jgi:hypothetical protein
MFPEIVLYLIVVPLHQIPPPLAMAVLLVIAQ